MTYETISNMDGSTWLREMARQESESPDYVEWFAPRNPAIWPADRFECELTDDRASIWHKPQAA